MTKDKNAYIMLMQHEGGWHGYTFVFKKSIQIKYSLTELS